MTRDLVARHAELRKRAKEMRETAAQMRRSLLAKKQGRDGRVLRRKLVWGQGSTKALVEMNRHYTH
jgi:hypothetical protein